MITAVLSLWVLSVLVLSSLLVLVIATQSGARLVRSLRDRHVQRRHRSGSTRPGPRRGPGLVVRAHGGKG